MVDPETLRTLLQYDPKTGKLYWKAREEITKGDKVVNKRFAGKEAFTWVSPCGYFKGTVAGMSAAAAHRVIWAMVHGYWPENIDHINGDRKDNRLSNLREVTKQENAQNQKRRSDNTSGISGVSWHAQNKRWRVRIQDGDKRVNVGMFVDLESAKAARHEACNRLGYGPNHGT